MLTCDTDILQCLYWTIQNCLLREDQGGYLKSQCVSVEEPPKTNILNVTSISANVCRHATPHLCFCLWLEILIFFCQQTLSHHNLIWHKKSFINLSKHFYFKAPLGLSVLHSLKLFTPNLNDACNSTVYNAAHFPEASLCWASWKISTMSILVGPMLGCTDRINRC